MIRTAAKLLNINLNRSFMIGDSKVDIFAGKNAGCKTIFYNTKRLLEYTKWSLKPDFVAFSWKEIEKIVLENIKN